MDGFGNGFWLGMVSGSFWHWRSFPLSLGQPDPLRSLGRAGPFKGMGLAHGGPWGTVPRGKPQFDWMAVTENRIYHVIFIAILN